MLVTLTHPRSGFTGVVTLLGTVQLPFTNGTASLDLDPALFSEVVASGIGLTIGAQSPAPPYDANLDAVIKPIVSASASQTNAALRAAFDARYAQDLSSRMRLLASRLKDPTAPLPGLNPDQPTITWATGGTLARTVSPATPEITIRGATGTWDSNFSRLTLSGKPSTLDFFVSGTQFEILATEQVANGSTFWIFSDGMPLTSAPGLGLTTSAGSGIAIKVVFSTAARRRITVYSAGLQAWNGLRIDFTTSLSPAPPLPKIAFVGDSFFGGSAGAPTLQACATTMTRLLGVNGFNSGYGGTGYGNAGSFSVYGSTGRVAEVAAFAPDLIVMSGSVNDTGTGIQAAAAACYAAYAAALPKTPIIVWGPQPSQATDTLTAGRASVNQQVKTAALAAPNVLAYYDMIGTASGTVPSAWASGGTYTPGQLVTYKGSVYKNVNAGASYNTGPYSPDVNQNWVLQTYVYTGTGKVGSTTGDGNRDILQYSDGVHPTVEGSLSLSIRQATDLRATLAAVS